MNGPGLYLPENDSEAEQQTKLLFKISVSVKKEYNR